jgi:hypothetical protein
MSMEQTTTRREQMEAVYTAEAEYRDYLDEHYGPLWGEENEAEFSRIIARLQRAYDTANVNEFDRIVL